jgi:hypothetical protein
MFFIAHLGGEHKELCPRVFPCLIREARFPACVLEKFPRIPSVFESDLGQEQSAVPAELQEQAVDTDPDVADILHRLKGGENGHLECGIFKLAR